MKPAVFLLAGTLAAHGSAEAAPQPLAPDDPRTYQHTHETTYGSSVTALWGNAATDATQRTTGVAVTLAGQAITATADSVSPSTSVPH